MKRHGFYLIFFLAVAYYGFQFFNQKSFFLETPYGSTVIHEPVLIELIHSKAMQRLKKVNQYGVVHFIRPHQNYTRYEHSLGVLFLLRKFGATLEEQVVGLLHDVSHTAFSHVADFLFESILDKLSYQDKISDWYIEQTDILPILKKYNCVDTCLIENRDKHIMLKKNLPSLCADRLEYNLYGGYLEGWLTKKELKNIVEHIRYCDCEWCFDDVNVARKFGYVSINLSRDIWCSAWNGFVCKRTAHLLKHAFDLQLFTHDDFVFSVDEHLWDILNNSSNPLVVELLQKIKEYKTSYILGSKNEHDLYIRGKFRGVDPLIVTEQGLTALSVLDSEFKSYFNDSKQYCDKGRYIKYL